MKTYIILFCILIGLALLASFPLNGRDDRLGSWKDGMIEHHEESVTDEIIHINAKLKLSDIEQFDIKMVEATEQPITITTTDHHRNKRATFTNDINKWSNGIIPYEFRSDIEGSASHVTAINEAIEEIHQKTKCIKFIRKASETQKHILFHIGNGCWSYVGNVTAFPTSQLLSIGHGCDVKGIVLHEIKHALGWYHEHARTDRDDYINVNYENILQENWKFFDKRNDIFGNTGGYDIDSIMHYSRYAFSKSYNLQSISWKGDQQQMVGQRYSLSDGDVKQLDEIYCGTHVATTSSPSKATTMPTTTTTTPATTTLTTSLPTTTKPITTITTTPATTKTTASKTVTPTTTKSTTSTPTATTTTPTKTTLTTTTPATTTSTTPTTKTTTAPTSTATITSTITTTSIPIATTATRTTTPSSPSTTNEQAVLTTSSTTTKEPLIETAFCIAINAKLLCEYEYFKSYLQTNCPTSCSYP